MTTQHSESSPFFDPGTIASPSSLAVLHLRRDQLLPTFLSDDPSTDSGYAEGQVTNTRFGSYPHSTLIGLPWGSQVVASQVDTGSRGRRDGTRGSKKRKGQQEIGNDQSPTKKAKLDENDDAIPDNTGTTDQATPDTPQTPQSIQPLKQPSAAASGFCHILPPTPESWTISLPHRTQVVYTPDYSFIIQKMRIRPGAIVLEAGAGSGSFTHAAARAVFNGYPPTAPDKSDQAHQPGKFGRVYSYEYHASRAEQLTAEIATHGLASIIHTTHRDVYTSGFLLSDRTSPNASHVFLDLPSPWHALPHLTRQGTTQPKTSDSKGSIVDGEAANADTSTNETSNTDTNTKESTSTSPSPLDPTREIHICIFLPCIEQVQRAVSSLRAHGWVEIAMHVIAHRRVDVRRERVGLAYHGVRGAGVNVTPGSVGEACRRLKRVEMHGRRFQNRVKGRTGGTHGDGDGKGDAGSGGGGGNDGGVGSVHRAPHKEDDGEDDEADAVPVFRQGRLVHRTEPEIRTHTSYLVFAVLPRSWE